MKKPSFSRREFVRNTSLGVAGAALSAKGITSFSPVALQDTGKPALLGGTPVRPKDRILGSSWPIYDDSDIQLYLEAFKSNIWSEYSHIESERVYQTEKKYAALMGVNYCVATSSGTAALETAQRAVNIGPGDEVITQTNTFIATALSTFNLFAIPVFIDSDPETFMINADLIEERINENTRAIIPVHIGGAAADMDKIMAIAKKHNLIVIEDACQAHMAEWRNRKLGTIGDMGCFSFQAGKSLCCGEGGAVLGNDEHIMAAAKGYTHIGKDPRNRGRVFAGSNFRMTPFQAAILTGQIRRIEEQSTLRDENAAYLEKLLGEIR